MLSFCNIVKGQANQLPLYGTVGQRGVKNLSTKEHFKTPPFSTRPN